MRPAPNSAIHTSTRRFSPGPPARVRCITSAISASIPPSPRLSARMTKARYFTEMTMMSAQKNRLSTPSTLAGEGSMPCGPWKHSRSAYSGEVPISP